MHIFYDLIFLETALISLMAEERIHVEIHRFIRLVAPPIFMVIEKLGILKNI